MSEITIQLDANALREATSQAIMATLSPEVREKMIQKAIEAILTPSTNSWERGNNPLQLALESAVLQVAREEAARIVKEDLVLRKKIEDLLRTTADKVLSSDPDKLSDRMASAFAESLRKES